MRKKNSQIKTKPEEPLTEAELWPKLLRYCAYQERAPAEVLHKMRQLGMEDAVVQERLLARLEEENYLSTDRFASLYTTSKLRQNKWGPRKIAMGMAAKGLSPDVIKANLQEMAPEAINKTLQTLLEKRDAAQYHALPMPERRQKLYLLGLRHGFEGDRVAEAVKKIIEN